MRFRKTSSIYKGRAKDFKIGATARSEILLSPIYIYSHFTGVLEKLLSRKEFLRALCSQVAPLVYLGAKGRCNSAPLHVPAFDLGGVMQNSVE